MLFFSQLKAVYTCRHVHENTTPDKEVAAMKHSTTQKTSSDKELHIYEPVTTKPLRFVLWIAVFLFVTIFAVPYLIDSFYKHWLGNGIWMTSSPFSCIPLLACLGYFILECVLFLEPENKDFTEPKDEAGNSGEPFSKKAKAAMLCLPLLFATIISILSIFRFHTFSSTGVESICFTNRTEYSWDNVKSFSLEDDWYGQLVFKLAFDDGSHAQFIGGATYYAWYTSEAFDSMYPDTDTDYARYLIKELCSRNVPAKIEDWDGLIDDLRYDSHQELAKELRDLISAESSSPTR